MMQDQDNNDTNKDLSQSFIKIGADVGSITSSNLAKTAKKKKKKVKKGKTKVLDNINDSISSLDTE